MLLLGVCLLFNSVTAAPTTDDFTKLVFTGNHDIVKIVVPINKINDPTDNPDFIDRGVTYFFVEADITPSGEKDYKGLYVSNNGTVKELLSDGTDVTATKDNSAKAYFGTRNGIYVYNYVKNSAERYGSLNDSIIGIANENGTGNIYILTKDKIVYKVLDDGSRKEGVGITNADQIIVDYSNNLYYRIGKNPYVVTKDGPKKVEGLPANPKYVDLTKHLMLVDDGVMYISDKNIYGINSNGTAIKFVNELKSVPTAVSVEAFLVNYYAEDKKIYESNIAEAIFSAILSGLKDFFNGLIKF